ncbi:MAG: winged helix-turn-helix transcriptional regulator [Acidobacteriota bacterium]|nr:MAG: winged helix-turn-helix transcriptional regulator [Acidobacteriota bacterium]
MKKQATNLMFRAFSDPTRLRILHLLGEGEVCVGDLVEILTVPQPTVSRHLSYLRRAGLVRARRNGRWCFYSLAGATTKFHRQLLDCLGSCFQEVPEIREDRVKKPLRASVCCAHGRGKAQR